MCICDFISTVKICEVDLHSMYYDLEKRSSPPHLHFFLTLSCTCLIRYVSPSGQSLYPVLIILLSSLEAKKYASCDSCKNWGD
jgi:hypothetical protein